MPKSKLDKIVSELQKQFGEEAIMTLGDSKPLPVEVISTGSKEIDEALGVGGLPKGRIVEIFGPEASGKTTLTLHLIAEAQKAGGKAAFVDAEHALDPEYAQKLGVKLSELIISQPETGEDALNIVEGLVRTGDISLVVIDSVAALIPKVELEGEMGAQYIGLQARMMAQGLRKLTGLAAKNNTLVVFVNQIRINIGGYGNPETTPGGKALKFFSSVRLEIRRTAQLKRAGNVIGSRVRVKAIKNKVAVPFKIAMLDIVYGEGMRSIKTKNKVDVPESIPA